MFAQTAYVYTSVISVIVHGHFVIYMFNLWYFWPNMVAVIWRIMKLTSHVIWQNWWFLTEFSRILKPFINSLVMLVWLFCLFHRLSNSISVHQKVCNPQGSHYFIINSFINSLQFVTPLVAARHFHSFCDVARTLNDMFLNWHRSWRKRIEY